MDNKVTTNIGPLVKEVRTSRKISRKDLAHICHPNTLRNFEVSFNQINIDDFTKILIDLGYIDYSTRDGLRTIATDQYNEYVTLCDEFDFFKIQYNKESLKADEHAEMLLSRMETYIKSDAFSELNIVLQQDIYGKYVVVSDYLRVINADMYKQGLELFYKSFQKGQSQYSYGEIVLMGALCLTPNKKENLFYKLCDKICETYFTSEYLKSHEYEFLYNYIELLNEENYRKFNTLKAKFMGRQENIMNIFYDIKNS
ncbi:MAG: hypothetical protein ACRCV7_01390 [Culicoidibacterales bacterium]